MLRAAIAKHRQLYKEAYGDREGRETCFGNKSLLETVF